MLNTVFYLSVIGFTFTLSSEIFVQQQGEKKIYTSQKIQRKCLQHLMVIQNAWTISPDNSLIILVPTCISPPCDPSIFRQNLLQKMLKPIKYKCKSIRAVLAEILGNLVEICKENKILEICGWKGFNCLHVWPVSKLAKPVKISQNHNHATTLSTISGFVYLLTSAASHRSTVYYIQCYDWSIILTILPEIRSPCLNTPISS